MKWLSVAALAVCVTLSIFAFQNHAFAREPAAAEGMAEGASCDPKAHAEDTRVLTVPIGNSPTQGGASSPVTIVEFTDYECPYCLTAEATAKALKDKYGERVRWVVKQLPLPMHPHAKTAALAALAAQSQGKFFAMHKKLFENHAALDEEGLEESAREATLDVAAWKRNRQSAEVTGQLEADAALAKTLGVKGVPAFFVNGHPLQGAQAKERFEALIDAELKR